MSLVNILVIVASLLTILSTITLVFGSTKSERRRSLWFLMASALEVVWAVSIAGFLSLGTGEADHAIAPWLIKGIYLGAVWMDVMLLGYMAWKYKFGKVAIAVLTLVATALTAIFCYDPNLLYSSYDLSTAGNTVTYLLPTQGGWFLVAYVLYFCMAAPAICFSVFYQMRHTSSKGIRKGYMVFLIGELFACTLSLAFNLILAVKRYDLIWVGPLAIGGVMIVFYYAVIKYRIVSLSASWLRVMSAVVLAASVVVVYLLLFNMMFSALFRVDNPSFQVVLFNFIMIAVVILLMPAIIEVWSLMRILATSKQIDVAYIAKKLLGLNRRKLNLKDISGFLAEYMHYEYVGFLMNGRYYTGEDGKLSTEAIEKIGKLPMPTRGAWQDAAALGTMAKEEGILRVAAMTDTNGDQIGQMVFGKPTTKTTLDREDIVRTEMVVNLMGTMLENGSCRKS